MIMSWDGLDNIIILNCDNQQEFFAYLKYLKKSGTDWEITKLEEHTKEEYDEYQINRGK